MNAIGLILPGLGNSGPDHWQSRWERADPSFVRVQLGDWDRPSCEEWLENLEQSVARAGTGAVLVAHSLACILVAHWAQASRMTIKSALLVAPPNADRADFTRRLADAWGSRYVSIGPAGHINAASALGDWPEGLALFRQLAA